MLYLFSSGCFLVLSLQYRRRYFQNTVQLINSKGPIKLFLQAHISIMLIVAIMWASVFGPKRYEIHHSSIMTFCYDISCAFPPLLVFLLISPLPSAYCCLLFFSLSCGDLIPSATNPLAYLLFINALSTFSIQPPASYCLLVSPQNTEKMIRQTHLTLFPCKG